MKYLDLVDISTIAYEAIHGICGYKGKNLPSAKIGNYLSEEEDRDKFLAVFHNKFLAYMSSIKSSSSGMLVIFDTFQNKSERFTIHPEYKDKRDENKMAFSQTHFKKCLMAYKAMLSSAGIFTVEFDRLEADDIIAFVCMNRGNISVRINSRDSDLLQLVSYGINSSVIFFNPVSEKAFVHELFQEKGKDETDFDFGGMFGETADLSISEWAKVVEKVNPNALLIEKVLIGDKTDNIPACIWYTKGSSTMALSEKRVQTALESFAKEIPSNFDWDFVDSKFMEHLNESVKTKKDPIILKSGNDDFKKAFERNMKLIKLDCGIIHDYAVDGLTILVEKIKSGSDGIKNSMVDALKEVATTGGMHSTWEDYGK